MTNQPQNVRGLLLADKPLGWTSFDVVNKVRSVFAAELGVASRKVKVGHSGTLDPAATGLLLLAIGEETKQLTDLVGLQKTYEATVYLGATSTTDDQEGEIHHRSVQAPGDQQVLSVTTSYLGEILQIPPAYSAIKVNGQRAYRMARAGKRPQLKPRTVVIKSIESITYAWPELSFVVTVSSGTYIRSLARDIGQDLSVGAYLSQLRRTHIGDYSVDTAVTIHSDIGYDELAPRLWRD